VLLREELQQKVMMNVCEFFKPLISSESEPSIAAIIAILVASKYSRDPVSKSANQSNPKERRKRKKEEEKTIPD
jgi:hypothetical protein